MQDYNKKYLTRMNKVSFAASGFGQNLIIGVVNSFILFFYTDVFLIPAAAVTTLMFVARVFDAVNDPIMGSIVDKTRTKWGKLRPYLLATIFPLMAVTILLFYAPDLSPSGKLIYAYITYLSFGIIYTICDVPFWGLASAMTPNPEERIKFISISRLFHTIGGALPILIIPLFTFIAKDNTKDGFFYAGLFIGVVGAGLFSLSFFGTKERCNLSEKTPTLKENVQFFMLNKPLQAVVIANILGFGRAMAVVSSMYVAVYLLGNASLNMLILGAWGVSGYAGMLLTPMIAKKLNYRQMYIMCAIIGVFAYVLLYLMGYSVFSIALCMFLGGFPYGIASNINYAMIADSVDYVEWKTGKRTEGVSISFQTLMNKLMVALQVTGVSFILSKIAFDQPISIAGDTITQLQTQGTLDGMFLMITAMPIVGWILCVIPMMFYKFVGKEREQAHIELTDRRNKIKKENALDVSEIEFFEGY